MPQKCCEKFHKKRKDIDLNISQFQWDFFTNFEETTNINITGLQQSSKKLCGNGEVYNIITSQCEKFSYSKGYKNYGRGCSKDNNTFKNTTRIDRNSTFARCFIEANVSLIFVGSPSRENEFIPDEVSKMLLNKTLHFTKVDLETLESNSSYQTSLYSKHDQSNCIQSIPSNRGSLIWEAIEKVYALDLPLKDFKNLSECAEAKMIYQIPNNFMKSCSYCTTECLIIQIQILW